MDQEKLARLRAMIEQKAMSPEAGIDSEAMAQAEAAAQAEREGNQMAQYANIMSTMAENVTGARKGHRLGMQQEALNKLKSLQGQAGKGDAFKALLERYRQAEINSRLGENLQRRDESLKQGQQKIGQAQQRIEQPSEKFAGEVSHLDTVKSHLDEIKRLKGSVNTGAILNAVNSFAGKWISGDIPTEERTKLKTLTSSTLADYIKSISGAAVTNEEAKRLTDVIPNMDDDDSVFESKLKQFEDMLASIRAEKLQALKSTGRDISKFEKTGESPSVKDVEKATEKLLSPRDAAAVKFINDNPDDPRAEKIKKALQARGVL